MWIAGVLPAVCWYGMKKKSDKESKQLCLRCESPVHSIVYNKIDLKVHTCFLCGFSWEIHNLQGEQRFLYQMTNTGNELLAPSGCLAVFFEKEI